MAMLANGVDVAAATKTNVNYEYSDDVSTGSIRFVSQNDGKTNRSPKSDYFHEEYWGRWVNGGANSSGPGAECGTASISMALSYVGINQTPEEILDANNGVTYFEGWGAELLTPSVEEGMQSLENGDGKYSPVIIHFCENGTYRSGHWVLLTEKNDAGYTVVDCNKNSSWVLSTSDVLWNEIDVVYQYYNEAAIIENDDITEKKEIPAEVTPVSLKLKVTKSNGSVYREEPGNKAEILGRYQKDETLTAVGYVCNKHNNIWYYLENGSYIFSENVEVISSVQKDSFRGPEGSMREGSIFILEGKVTCKNPMTVSAAVVQVDTGEVIFSLSETTTDGSYSLRGSKLDKAMMFNLLPYGNYTYSVSVTESVDTGKMCKDLTTKVYTSSFNIQ